MEPLQRPVDGRAGAHAPSADVVQEGAELAEFEPSL